jgi:hypothetical protein
LAGQLGDEIRGKIMSPKPGAKRKLGKTPEAQGSPRSEHENNLTIAAGKAVVSFTRRVLFFVISQAWKPGHESHWSS